MPTVTGKFILADSAAREFAEVAFVPAHAPAVFDDDRIVLAHPIRLVTDADGTFSQPLAPAFYRVTVDRRDAFDISVPDVAGPLAIGTLLVTGGIPAIHTGLVWFNDIQHMLTEDSRTWKDGRTLNSYGNDGIISGWDRVLLTDPIAAGITPNEDSRLATQDGFALCVRKFLAN